MWNNFEHVRRELGGMDRALASSGWHFTLFFALLNFPRDCVVADIYPVQFGVHQFDPLPILTEWAQGYSGGSIVPSHLDSQSRWSLYLGAENGRLDVYVMEISATPPAPGESVIELRRRIIV